MRSTTRLGLRPSWEERSIRRQRTLVPLASLTRLFRETLVLLVLCCTISYLAFRLDEVFPISRWPLWRYVLVALYVVTWATATLGVGMRAVSLVLRKPIFLGPDLAISFGVGVYVFFALTFVTGAFGQLRSGYFLWGPLLLLAVGSGELFSLVRGSKIALTTALLTRPRLMAWETLGAAFALALAGCTLLPSLAGYDAMWYHLPLAEQYAHTGTIHSYPEGWILAAYPHLASVIYAWAFLAPGLEFHEHTILACQIEFVCECAGWLSIPLLVGSLLREKGFRWSWASIFLFPAVFYFRPSGGADHFPALWAVCLYFGTLEVWPRFDFRRAILLGLLVGAVLCTKYSCYVLLPGLGLSLLGRGAVLTWRLRLRNPSNPSRGQLARALGGFASAALLTSTPHWLKNLLFYGDPVFPLGRHWFSAHPWTQLAERLQENFWNSGELARPTANWAGLRESLVALVDFSFEPRSGLETIYFGSLFTLSLPLLPWLRLSRRVWGLSAWTLSSIFCWYWLHHQDRYLVSLLPWMSAVTVACLLTSARSSVLARPFVLALVLLQGLQTLRLFALVLPHGMLFEVYAGARSAKTEVAFRTSLRGVAKRLPEDAVVLVHDEHLLLGLDRKTVADAVAWQGGIDYLEQPTDQGVYRRLRHLGVTHLLWRKGDTYAWDSDGGYLAFGGFTVRHGRGRITSGDYHLAEMPIHEPTGTARPTQVLVALCPGSYPAGVYPITALNIPGLDRKERTYPRPLRPVRVNDRPELQAEIERVDALLVTRTCAGQVASLLRAPFSLAFRRGDEEGWVRVGQNP